jgi:hypothetical protein
MSWRIHADVVVLEGVICGAVNAGGIAAPVVLDLVVVDDVDPWEIFADGRPRWGRIYLAVFAAVCLCILAVLVRDIDVNKVAQEQHEIRFQFGKPMCEMLQTGKFERMLEGIVGDTGLDATGMHKRVLLTLELRHVSGTRRSSKRALNLPA